MSDIVIQNLMRVRHSPIYNYVIPGLASWLIGEPTTRDGCLRLFVSTRKHQETIVPHSHRFDFEAVVLRGSVTNTIWNADPEGDLFQKREIRCNGQPGDYTHVTESSNQARFSPHPMTYSSGETYSMRHDQIHSISFERDTWVLFFEGPRLFDWSTVIEPVVGGVVVPTFKVEPWMFRKG